MGRLHSKGKGISASAIPYSRNPPAWLKTTPEQVVEQICKLARKGATPSQIGVILRDSHGIAQVKFVTGMLRIVPEKDWGSLGSMGFVWMVWLTLLDDRQQDPPHPQEQWYGLSFNLFGFRSFPRRHIPEREMDRENRGPRVKADAWQDALSAR